MVPSSLKGFNTLYKVRKSQIQNTCLKRNKFSIIMIIILSPLLQTRLSCFGFIFCTTFLLCNKINFHLHISPNFLTAVTVPFSFSYQVIMFSQQQKTSENSTSQPQRPSARIKGYTLIPGEAN